MRRWLAVCVFVCLTCGFLTGCWDSRDLQQRAVVLVAGIDPDDNQGVTVSLQLAQPTRFGGLTRGSGLTADKRTLTVTGHGADVAEALTNIQRSLDRDLFYGHLQAIVVNQQLARGGIIHLLNPLIQARIVPRRVWLFVSEGLASEVTRLEPQLNTVPARHFTNFFDNEILLHRPDDISIGGFHERLVTPGIEPVALWVGGADDLSAPKITGLALFRGERLIGTLTRDQLLVWAQIVNQFPPTTVEFHCPTGDGRLSVFVQSLKSQVRVQKSAGGPVVNVHLYLRGYIEGGVCAGTETPAWLQTLEQAVNRQLTDQALSLIRACQTEWRSDIFGFGQTLYQSDIRDWPGDGEWEAMFPHARVSVQADSTLRFLQTYTQSAVWTNDSALPSR